MVDEEMCIRDRIMDMFGLPVEQMLTTLTDVEVSEKERIDAFIEEYKRQYPIYMAHASLIDGAYETLKTVYNRQIPTVSYTHLDVYKRQGLCQMGTGEHRRLSGIFRGILYSQGGWIGNETRDGES